MNTVYPAMIANSSRHAGNHNAVAHAAAAAAFSESVRRNSADLMSIVRNNRIAVEISAAGPECKRFVPFDPHKVQGSNRRDREARLIEKESLQEIWVFAAGGRPIEEQMRAVGRITDAEGGEDVRALETAEKIGNSWFYSPGLNVLTIDGVVVPPREVGWRSLDDWPAPLRDLERVWPTGYEFAKDADEALYFRPKPIGSDEHQRAIDFLKRLDCAS